MVMVQVTAHVQEHGGSHVITTIAHLLMGTEITVGIEGIAAIVVVTATIMATTTMAGATADITMVIGAGVIALINTVAKVLNF